MSCDARKLTQDAGGHYWIMFCQRTDPHLTGHTFMQPGYVVVVSPRCIHLDHLGCNGDGCACLCHEDDRGLEGPE